MKYRKIRKELSEKRAISMVMNTVQSYITYQEEIAYWKSKYRNGKYHIDRGDMLILVLCNQCPAQIIDEAILKIDYLEQKLEDLRRFYAYDKYPICKLVN